MLKTLITRLVRVIQVVFGMETPDEPEYDMGKYNLHAIFGESPLKEGIDKEIMEAYI